MPNTDLPALDTRLSLNGWLSFSQWLMQDVIRPVHDLAN